jgi:hypothetical protein
MHSFCGAGSPANSETIVSCKQVPSLQVGFRANPPLLEVILKYLHQNLTEGSVAQCTAFDMSLASKRLDRCSPIIQRGSGNRCRAALI